MKKNNVLLIHVDQHRKDCLGIYGNKQIKTPNIDALAENGIYFTNHYCSYPACTPSRYSLLCGQQVQQHLGWSNRSTLPGGIMTFPRIFKNAGYRTAAVGKMHFTPTYLDVGFSDLYLAEQDGPGRFEDDYHQYLMDNDSIDLTDLFDQRSEFRKEAKDEYWQSFGAKPSELPLEKYSTEYITRQALNCIDQWQDGGNLLMVGYIKPHHPFDPPKPYSEMYDQDSLDILPGFTSEIPDQDQEFCQGYFDFTSLDEVKLKRIMALYYGTISHIDDNVGKLVEKLKSNNLFNQTIIVYTTDHGEYMGYHHLLLKGGPMYEPLMNIPLIIKPVDGKTGVCDSLSSNVDIAAQLLESCGLKPSQSMSAAGLGLEKSGREFVRAENLRPFSNRYEYMLRSGDYKILASGSFDNIRLYNIKSDPTELIDLASFPEHQMIKRELINILCNDILFSNPTRHHRDNQAKVIFPGNAEKLILRKKVLKTWYHEKTGIEPDK